jgi:hypothetical protein
MAAKSAAARPLKRAGVERMIRIEILQRVGWAGLPHHHLLLRNFRELTTLGAGWSTYLFAFM